MFGGRGQIMGIRSLTVLALPFITSDCGVARMSDQFANSGEFIEIVVDNRYLSDVRIWAVSGAGNEYLGVVMGKNKETFTHRWLRPDDLRLLVRTIGGRSFTTRGIDTAPGESVEVQVPARFPP